MSALLASLLAALSLVRDAARRPLAWIEGRPAAAAKPDQPKPPLELDTRVMTPVIEDEDSDSDDEDVKEEVPDPGDEADENAASAPAPGPTVAKP